jgi:hypothetical protein
MLINFEIFVSKNRAKGMRHLPEGLFVIPPPSSNLEGSQSQIRSKVIDDFSPNRPFSINVRSYD